MRKHGLYTVVELPLKWSTMCNVYGGIIDVCIANEGRANVNTNEDMYCNKRMAGLI
jgi:hypothetical protein